ncbi:PTS transporter subunit IIC [Sporolactobacillus nakayamae]|uniref:PTS system, galactitol-specific IIC component n=1 Tax=Sporolactobacillus nakayamae TaxID=269670 RepID=A0A1I2UVF0_9BACL|nr:PTS transporter subunit IIC [Sporolactobacillus nakayamae]SFG78741.1 PTS system, galactitol-specific IIC component [Sporolactobacillus nakayamae]
MSGFQQVMSTFGAAILLPIIIFIFELCLRVKPTKAFRSAIFIGIGLNGLVSILNPYFLGLMGKAVSEMVTSNGFQLPYVDTGWALLAALGYSTTIGALIIPLGIVVNLILLWLKLTDTLDLDIWNFWHWAFIGSMVYFVTGSLIAGILTSVAVEIFLLVLADITAPAFQAHFKLPGISFPHASAQGGAPVAFLLKWVFERIGLTKIQVNSTTIRKKFGIFGDSVVIGFLVAVLIGFIAWFRNLGAMETWSGILTLGVGTGAFIYLYPKATAALLEGFAVLNDKVRTLLTKKGVKRQINFGMDGALTIGHPDVITVGLLGMISTVPLIFFLPGNRFLMLADLGVTPFFLASATVAIFRGNIICSYITNVINIAITLYFSSAISPEFFAITEKVGMKLPDTGAAMVGADMRPLHGIFYYVGQNYFVLVGVIALTLIAAWLRKQPKYLAKLGFKKNGES